MQALFEQEKKKRGANSFPTNPQQLQQQMQEQLNNMNSSGEKNPKDKDKVNVISNLQHLGTSSSEITSNIKDLLGLGGFGIGGGVEGDDKKMGSIDFSSFIGTGGGGNGDFPPMHAIGDNMGQVVGIQAKPEPITFQSDDFPSLDDTMNK